MSSTSSVVSIPKPEINIPRLLKNISVDKVPAALRKSHLERALTSALETLFVDAVLRHGDKNPRQQVPEKVLLFAMANISECLLTSSGASWQSMADKAWEVFHDHIQRGAVYQKAHDFRNESASKPAPLPPPPPPVVPKPLVKKVELVTPVKPVLIRPEFDMEVFVKTLPPVNAATGLFSETALCAMSIQLCEVFSAAIQQQVELFRVDKPTVPVNTALSLARQGVTSTLRETKTRSLEVLYNTAWEKFVDDFWNATAAVRRRIHSTQKD